MRPDNAPPPFRPARGPELIEGQQAGQELASAFGDPSAVSRHGGTGIVGRHRTRLMNRLFSTLFLFTICLSGSAVFAEPLPSPLRTESLGFSSRSSIQATHCTITEVQASEQSMFVVFTGRWSPQAGFADTDRNGFSISRDKSVSQSTWDFLARRFRGQQGKTVTITITTAGGFTTRGGIPLVRFPADTFDITSLEPK